MTRPLEYALPDPAARLRRQLSFWRMWSLVATALLGLAVLVLLSTGPRLWIQGVRELLRQWLGTP